jgi:hypothetical protein
MAAYVPSMISGASASALALGYSVLGYHPPHVDAASILPDVPTITLAARATGPTLWKTVAVTVTSSVPANQLAGIMDTTLPGQVVSCGDLIVIHGTRTARGVDPTTPALLDQDIGAWASGPINAICFRRVRRDMDTVAEKSDDVLPILCVPMKRDTPDIAARQLTACETSFTIPTPTIPARRAIPTPPEPESAEWNIYLPDGRSLHRISDELAEYEGYGLAMQPVSSLCYHNGPEAGLDDGATREDPSTGSGISVVCHPAGADASAGEVGRLMI